MDVGSQPHALQGASGRRRADAAPLGHARRRRVRQEQSLRDEVYCRLRPQKSSSAEVDYVVASGGRAVPIEVKSGLAGRLRSLHFVPLYYAGTLIGQTTGR